MSRQNTSVDVTRVIIPGSAYPINLFQIENDDGQRDTRFKSLLPIEYIAHHRLSTYSFIIHLNSKDFCVLNNTLDGMCFSSIR